MVKKRADDSGLPPSNESYMSEPTSRFAPFSPLSPLSIDSKKKDLDPGYFGDAEDFEQYDKDYLEYMADEEL